MPDTIPQLPTDAEIVVLRERLKTDQAPRESWRKLIEMLLNAYVYAKASVQQVLRESDAAISGLTRSADAEIERLNAANIELRSKLAQAEADGRQAAANCVDAQIERDHLRIEVASLRNLTRDTADNATVCSHCGERMPCLFHNVIP